MHDGQTGQRVYKGQPRISWMESKGAAGERSWRGWREEGSVVDKRTTYNAKAGPRTPNHKPGNGVKDKYSVLRYSLCNEAGTLQVECVCTVCISY